MHANGDVRVLVDQGVNQPGQHAIAGIGARAAAGLKNDGRLCLVRGGHDGEALLHVGDVESRHAVAIFGGVVEKLAKRDAGHGVSPQWRGMAATILRSPKMSGQC